MSQPPIVMAYATDPGRQRAHNEDALYVDTERGLAILADGMGGYKGGEVASSMTTTLLGCNLQARLDAAAGRRLVLSDPIRILDEEIQVANLAVFNAALHQPQYEGMGTTLVMAWLLDNALHVAHVGDSRLYRWREGELQQLTHDHSILQEQIDRGMMTEAEARRSEHRNLVTRALGVEATVDVDIHSHDVRLGDLLLMCSDGLTDMLDDRQIVRLLQQGAGSDLKALAGALVAAANMAGGRDNISVVIIRINGDFAVQRGWWYSLQAFLK